MARARLTTTSYAILGQLALRPWSMYELAAEMRRNVRFFYPRAESQVYEEPKRLVALGLAKAQKTPVGRRVRTVYSITQAGEKALKRWLATPVSKGITLEFEGLLRVLLAPIGTEAGLRRTLVEVREDIAALAEVAAKVRSEYLAGEAPFQRYAPTRAFVFDFLVRFADLVDEWAERSLLEIDASQGLDEGRRMKRAIGTFAQAGGRLGKSAIGRGHHES